MIPPANRPYVRGSIMTLCIVLGITLSGVSRLIFPGAVSTSSALQALPSIVLLALNLAWITSGLVTAGGILSGRRNIEGAGLILMTGAFLSYFLSILFFKPDSAISVIYIFGFSVGAAWRARYVLSETNVLVVLAGRLPDAIR